MYKMVDVTVWMVSVLTLLVPIIVSVMEDINWNLTVTVVKVSIRRALLYSLWSLLLSVCIDKDECSLGTDDCDNVCFNNVGSYTCGCGVGYTLGSDELDCEGDYIDNTITDAWTN